MINKVVFMFMLLVSTTYSKDLTSCKKMGEISNNINNEPLYSMGLYMCIELPNTQIIENTILPPLLSENIQNLSNSTFNNQSNYYNFTNSTKKTIEHYNSSHVIKNSTNISTSLTTTQSPTTTDPPQTTTDPPQTTTDTPSPTTETPTTETLTTETPTTETPTTTETPITIDTIPPITVTSPSSTTNSPSKIPTNILKLNKTNVEPSSSIKFVTPTLDKNPLFPVVIGFGSLFILIICYGCCRWLYKQKRVRKIFAGTCPEKSEDNKENKETDIESGEKKNRNSWGKFTHTNLARDKLKALEVFKGGRKRKNKSKTGLKPRLQQLPKKQEEALKKIEPKIKMIPPPDISTAKSTLKGLHNKQQRNNVRNTLLETAKTMPNGQNNPRLQAMLKKFPEEPIQTMDDENKKWHKDEFHTELDILNRRPLTPPPSLPVPSFDGKSQPPRKIMHSNPHNKNSPKMVISELNPETNIQYLN